MAQVVLDQVTKRYASGLLAVRDLTLTVADGELVVLVGPSGCGKTTTLRLIAGLEQPTSGLIRIGSQTVDHLPPHRRDVALVFQRPALYPHLTVRDNLAFGLRMRQRSGWLARLTGRWLRPGRYAQLVERERVLAEQVEQTARLLGLEGVLDRQPSQLSGGEQQRVALGRALVRRPAAFLLDEPLSNLDAPLRAEMRRELHLLHRRLPATILYVTHDPVEAQTLADRVVVLKEGVVQQIGRPQAVYDRPHNRFVAGFFGWPSMNLMDGQVVLSEGGPSFVTGGHRLPLPAMTIAGWHRLIGRPLTLGIRPEDIRLQIGDCRLQIAEAEDATNPQSAICNLQSAIEMRVMLVEPLGASALVTLQRGDWRLTALATGRPEVTLGQQVDVRVAMERAHWFDGPSGLALTET
jgi:multiple sugar transport system ATP-binding protein